MSRPPTCKVCFMYPLNLNETSLSLTCGISRSQKYNPQEMRELQGREIKMVKRMIETPKFFIKRN